MHVRPHPLETHLFVVGNPALLERGREHGRLHLGRFAGQPHP